MKEKKLKICPKFANKCSETDYLEIIAVNHDNNYKKYCCFCISIKYDICYDNLFLCFKKADFHSFKIHLCL